MSTTYKVNGYVDVRIKLVDKNVNSSSSATAQDVAEIVKIQIEETIYNIDILNHSLMIEEI